MGEKRSNYELRQERRLSLLTSPVLAPSSLACLSCLILVLLLFPEQAREAPLLYLPLLSLLHLPASPVLPLSWFT